MSVPPSSPKSDCFASPEDGRLERFLELAAPVLLEEPDLESEATWRQLERMAERAGLNGDELKGVVESLRQEGVIAGGDTSRGSSDPTSQPISDEEIDSYLTPLPAPRRPLPPPPPIAERWRAAAAAARRDPTRFLTGDPKAGKSPAQLKAQIRVFLQNAEGVIAEQRGMTPRACMLLTDLAHSMGLAEHDYDEALAVLRTRSRSSVASDPAHTDRPPVQRGAGRAEPRNDRPPRDTGGLPDSGSLKTGSPETGSLETAAHPREMEKSESGTANSPDAAEVAARASGNIAIPVADRYRKYLSVAIGEKQRTRGYISESAERKLIDEGVSKLGLSTVYARHLVLEMAERSRIPVLSRQQGERGEPVDERLERFMARAAPILAQERGATQRAYVLLATIAQELELGDESFRQGMKLLQSAWGEAGKGVDWQQERRVAWSGHLQHAFQGLSGQVLTPSELERLVRMGVERFGLDETVTISLLRQAATGSQVHLIWQDQALAHMRVVIGQALGDRVRLDKATQTRLASEGEQWGIAGDQVRLLIDNQAGENLRRRRRERRMATIVVIVGFLATVIAMISFYLFVFLPRMEASRALNGGERGTTLLPAAGVRDDQVPLGPDAAPESELGRDSSEEDESSSSTGMGESSRRSRRTAWWDDGMRIAWVNLRRELSESQLAQWQGVEGESAEARAASYESLIQMLVDDGLGPGPARNAHDFVSRAVVVEPDPAAVDRWLDAALAAVPEVDQAIPDDPAEYARTLRAVRLVAVAVLRSRTSGENESRIVSRVHRKLPVVVTKETPATDVEREYVGELMRRWCQNVTQAARSLETARVAEHWMAIRPTMTRNLTRDEVVLLTINLLKAALPHADDDWRLLQLAIQDAILSPETNHVLRMVDVFERVPQDGPRRYMAALLLSRAEVSFQDLVHLDDIPGLVRKALGAPAGTPLDEQELAQSWMERVDELLADVHATSASDQQKILQTMQLARLASWGMAMVRRQPDAALALARRGDAELAASDDDLPPDDPAMFGASSLLRGGMSRNFDSMRQAADVVRKNGANAWQQRLRGLDVIARTVPAQPDLLTADMASDVASYLLSNRSVPEHRERLARVPSLRNSVTLQIALAHEVGHQAPRDSAAKETVATFLGDEMALDSMGADWPRTVQRHLLQQALNRLPGTSTSHSVNAVEQLHESLWQEYREQAQLLGIPSSAWSELATAAEVRRVMLEHHAEFLLARWNESSKENKARARKSGGVAGGLLPERIPGEILAAEYVATHDIALTILLDRLWLRLLAWEMEFEERVDGASVEVFEGLADADQRASGLLEQLRATQEATVKLWGLRLPGRVP